MIPATTNEVSCNGHCRKRYRPAAVNMDSATANVLIAPVRVPGLLWLCPECHLTFNLQQTTKLCESDLPPELLILVFQYLDNNSMLRVRSTCRRWKEIVDQNRSLRKELRVDFDKYITMDERFQPENLFPALLASCDECKINSVGGWWPSFGAVLTSLSLWSCKIALPTLLTMLRRTPNLNSLYLDGIEYTSVEETEADFRLEKLEYVGCEQLFDVFVIIFPKLKHLCLASKLNGGDEAKACRLITSVQGTLKHLTCYVTPFMLEQIASMKRLQLKNVVHRGKGDLAVQLSRIQITIKELSTTSTTNEALLEIGRNLPMLKYLSVVIKDEEKLVPPFLTVMPQLKHLHLDAVQQKHLNLECFKSTNLTNLELKSCRISSVSLQSFLENSPNLKVLIIMCCSLHSWSDIFAARLESLHCLTVGYIDVVHNSMNVSKSLEQLEELEILNCSIPVEIVIEMLRQCPRLKKLTFVAIHSIDDDFIGILDQFPQLKELKLYECAITDMALELIAENYSRLKVDIRSEDISEVALRLLNRITRST